MAKYRDSAGNIREASGVTGAATQWADLTADGNDLPRIPNAVYVGEEGTVVAKGWDGVESTFTAAAGQILPIQPVSISSSSTAGGLVGLFF